MSFFCVMKSAISGVPATCAATTSWACCARCKAKCNCVGSQCIEHWTLARALHLFDALIAHATKQRLGTAVLRDDQRWVDLDERHECKGAFDQARMRHDQIGFVDRLIAV